MRRNQNANFSDGDRSRFAKIVDASKEYTILSLSNAISCNILTQPTYIEKEQSIDYFNRKEKWICSNQRHRKLHAFVSLDLIIKESCQ